MDQEKKRQLIARLHRLNRLSAERQFEYLLEKLTDINDRRLAELIIYHTAEYPLHLYFRSWEWRLGFFTYQLLQLDNNQIKLTVLEHTTLGITQCLNMAKVSEC
ncbi:MAG: hypothetical protein ACOZBH_02545 [Patescibacteria group bacterium]